MARIIRYTWISYWDETLERRVSDWDGAQECGRCGRAIVHVVTVLGDDGAEWEVGRECAHILLGWPTRNERRLDAEIARVKREQAARERNRAYWRKISRDHALPTAVEAEEACRFRNRDLQGNYYGGPTRTFRREGIGYYALPVGCMEHAQALLEEGWEEVTAG